MNATLTCTLRRCLWIAFFSISVTFLCAPCSAQGPSKPSQGRIPVSGKRSSATTPNSARTNEESKAYKSLDRKGFSPLTDQLQKLGIFSGFYDFNDNVEDKVVGTKKPDEVAFSNRAFIQTEYTMNPDLRRENGFVGLWASVPLRTPGKEGGQPNPERSQTRRVSPPAQTQNQSFPHPAKPGFQVQSLFRPKSKPVSSPNGKSH